jgi:hypothetical protein
MQAKGETIAYGQEIDAVSFVVVMSPLGKRRQPNKEIRMKES